MIAQKLTEVSSFFFCSFYFSFTAMIDFLEVAVQKLRFLNSSIFVLQQKIHPVIKIRKVLSAEVPKLKIFRDSRLSQN
jgi:hypothetical protein